VQDLEKALHYAEKLAEVYQSGLHRPYGNRQPVQGLREMHNLYQLTPAEAMVFKVLAEYNSLEQLRSVADCLYNILSEVLKAAQANTSAGRYPPSMAGEPPQ
jgi:hypothetical protein